MRYYFDVSLGKWFMTDDGPSIVEGIKAHKADEGNNELRGSCSVHLFMQVLPKHKNKLNDRGNYGRIELDLKRLQLVPPFKHEVAWQTIQRYWIKKPEGNFMKWLSTSHIDKNGGWRDHLWGTGMSTSNNTQESSNRHGTRKSLQQFLTDLYPRAKLPVAFVPTITIIFEQVVPDWSTSNQWSDGGPEVTARERKEADTFAKQERVLKIAPHVYACRQKTNAGP